MAQNSSQPQYGMIVKYAQSTGYIIDIFDKVCYNPSLPLPELENHRGAMILATSLRNFLCTL